MSNDPYDALSTAATRSVTAASEVGDDPYDRYTAPKTASPVHTPRAPTELTAAPGDKYRAEAMRQREKMLQPGGLTGGDPGENFAGRPMRGNLFGWQDEIGAAVGTPAEMVRQGTFNPAEGYRYAKAKEKLASEARDAAHGGWGTGAELIGGLSTGAGVLGGTRAGSNAASVLTRAPQTTIPWTNRVVPTGVANWSKNVGQGMGLGAVGGAGGAENIEGIPAGLAMGGVLGGFVGGAAPIVTGAVGHGARALQMPRLRDPEKIATEQLAEVARRAGVDPSVIAQRVADAQASGQPYTWADAVGYEAQRKLAAMAKQPGEQRARIAEAVLERQENMPYRVGGEISRFTGAQGTAEQAQRELAQRASRQGGPAYREAEQHPTWSSRLQEQFLDDPIAHAGIREGVELQRLRAAGTDRPFRPQDAMITNFNEAGEPIYSGVPNVQTLQTLKMGLDRMVEQNTDEFGRLNARGNAIAGFRNRMLAEMDAINPAYAHARATYADPMQIREAVNTGRDMASRGRPENTVPAFHQLREGEQQGVRIGWGDKLQDDLSRTGNFPPLLRSKVPKGRQELEALTLDAGPLRPGEPSMARKFLTREEEMQRTNKAATGGSPTAENIADINASPGGAEALGALTSAATGNVAGVGSNLLSFLKRTAAGENEAQRVAITRGLLQPDPDMIRQMAARIAVHEQRRRGVNPWAPQRPPRYPEGE